MISSVYKCGCLTHPSSQNSHTSLSNTTKLKKCSPESSNEMEDENNCDCGTKSNFEKEKSLIASEIVETGLPYKEIEAFINDNRMVIRMQTESPKPEFEPSCDCLTPDNIAQNKQRDDVTFQKASQGCKTLSLYPQPDQKSFDNKSEDIKKSAGDKHLKLSTTNPEENPNIFILKIKKKRENGDKRYNLDLEFRAPRPWQKQKCK